MPKWVFRLPAAYDGVIIPSTKTDKADIVIIDTTGKPKGLESSGRVFRDIPELVVIHALGDVAGCDIYNEARAAELITDDAVRSSTFDHIVWDVVAAGVDKTADHIIATIQLCNWVQAILIQKPLDEGAVKLFSDSPISPIDHIFDESHSGLEDGFEIAEHVVIVDGGLSINSFGE